MTQEDDDRAPITRYETAYQVVAERIRRRIVGGEWEWRTPLPSEYALAEHYGVSRPTVRSAIAILADGGMVEKRPGKGTFVTWRPELCPRAPRREPGPPVLDASGCILSRPDRPQCVPLASAGMGTDDDEAPQRIPLRNSEYRYVQVAGDLEARIRAGEFPFDARLPARDVLAVEYHVGEMTVRRALRELAERGMVRPMPSVGTVVIWAGHEEGT